MYPYRSIQWLSIYTDELKPITGTHSKYFHTLYADGGTLAVYHNTRTTSQNAPDSYVELRFSGRPIEETLGLESFQTASPSDALCTKAL